MLRLKKTTNLDNITDYLQNILAAKLSSGQKVFWLVGGGSSTGIVVAVAKHLKNQDLTGLSLTLTDERYGQPGHSDSNWRRLMDAGFKLPGALLYPPLNGGGLEETVYDYSLFLNQAFSSADYSLALIGVGEDSHVAGIKPNSPATSSTDLAVGYKWEDFTRITMTFEAIKKLDLAVTYMAGELKREAIKDFKQDLPLKTYPSQILKQVKEAIIFNNIEEGDIE